MKYLAAYCLATLGGNASPSADDVEKILTSVGVNVDKAQLELALTALKGKSLHEVILPSNFIS